MLGGGTRAVLHDYATFLNMISNNGIFKGNRVLSENAITEMEADQIGEAKVSEHEFVERVRAQMHNGIYGLGEWREELDNEGRAILISSPGWAGAYPWIDKTTHTYGFFITHVNVDKANQNGFSSFYSSPLLPIMVRELYKKADLSNSVKSK